MREQDVVVEHRLEKRIAELHAIGAQPDGGVTRLAYSTEERRAHELLADWAAADGAVIEVDSAGNTIVTLRDGVPYFLLGSHLDTVTMGGDFDGTVGVLGGLEAARLVKDHVQHGVRVVAFAGEEGARFGQATIGSSLAAGLLPKAALTDLHDTNGVSLERAAKQRGLDPRAVAPWVGPDVACFFEIHIEQGRRLESNAIRIGLVDAIAGTVRLRFTIRGRADHSGSTPMPLRADALTAASEIVLAAERVARRRSSTVATVGMLQVTPNNLTTVPGYVLLSMDIRDIDADLQRLATEEILTAVEETRDRRPVQITTERVAQRPPIALHSWPRAIAHSVCERAGVAHAVLPSGAAHDAAIVAQVAPAMMVFIPCVEGISHSPLEKASVKDVAAAVSLLAETLLDADAIIS